MTASGAPQTKPWPLLRPLRGVGLGALPLDLAAGLTLAAIAIPEQMATARLAGFAPQIGLFAFVAATLAFVVFGANRVLSAGADSTIAPIFAGSLAALAVAGTPAYAGYAATLALMVGLIVAIAGLAKLGWIADLLSRPVITGFLAGIAAHIVLSQAPAALGLPEASGAVYARAAAIVRGLGHANGIAAAIALAVFATTFTAEKLSPRFPGALVAVAGATLATAMLGLERQGVAVVGALPGGLPTPAMPSLSLASLPSLVGLAATVALVVMVQTAATTRSFTGGDRDPDVDRDYVGVGAANLAAALFGAFPVNASPPRSAAVTAAGGRTQVGGLVAAGAVLALATFGGALMAHAPQAALAGVLLFIAARIFHIRDFAELARRSHAEFGLAALTAVLIIVLPTQTGVAIGMFLSLAHGVFIITRARLIPFERAPNTTVWWPAPEDECQGEQEPGVLVMGFQAPLSFLNAYAFRRDAERAIAARGDARLLVLEASSIVEIDFTAAQMLGEMVKQARDAGLDVAVARLESIRAQQAFQRFGLTDQIGADHMFQSVAEAIAKLKR